MRTKLWVQKQKEQVMFGTVDITRWANCVSFFWNQFSLLSLRGAWSKSEDSVVPCLMYWSLLSQSVWSVHGSEEGEAFLSWIINPGTQRLSQRFDIGTFIMVRNGGKLHYFTLVLTYMSQYKTEWLLFNVLCRVFGCRFWMGSWFTSERLFGCTALA